MEEDQSVSGPGLRSEEVSQEAPPCYGATDLFYGPEADLRLEPKAEKAAREAEARSVCRGCELRWECLSLTLVWESKQEDKEERFGIWGGASPGDRRELVRHIKHDIGRLWREGIADLDYLQEITEEFYFVKRIEREDRIQARQGEQATGKEPVTPIVVGRGGSRGGGARSVSSGSGDRGVGRQKGSAPPKAQHGDGAFPKAASASGLPARSQKVRG